MSYYNYINPRIYIIMNIVMIIIAVHACTQHHHESSQVMQV